MDFDAERGHVLFFKLARQVTLDKGRLADPAVADEDQFEFRNGWLRL